MQTYNLKDPASVLKVVKHSNVVINLVGRDYETRSATSLSRGKRLTPRVSTSGYDGLVVTTHSQAFVQGNNLGTRLGCSLVSRPFLYIPIQEGSGSQTS